MLGLVLFLQTVILFFILWTIRNRERLPSSSEIGKELEELAERIADDLEKKVAALEASIEKADARIQALSELQASLRIEAWKQEKESEEPTPRFSVPPQYLQVYNLLRAGKSVAQVARETQIAKGEVQLILDLAESHSRKKK